MEFFYVANPVHLVGMSELKIIFIKYFKISTVELSKIVSLTQIFLRLSKIGCSWNTFKIIQNPLEGFENKFEVDFLNKTLIKLTCWKKFFFVISLLWTWLLFCWSEKNMLAEFQVGSRLNLWTIQLKLQFKIKKIF